MASRCEVSVVIATYRRDAFLREALASALRQRASALEVIVVDDSEERAAEETARGAGDPHVRYVARAAHSKSRPGLVRNDGARVAKGDWLLFLDDDDRLPPDALGTLAGAIARRPRAGMAFGCVEAFGADAAVLAHERAFFARAAKRARGCRGSRALLAAQLLFREACLVNSAAMVRRAVFEAVGGYDPEVPAIEDVDLFLRVARASGFAFVDRTVLGYRKGHPSVRATPPSDAPASISEGYRRMQAKYRTRYGRAEFYALKAVARARR